MAGGASGGVTHGRLRRLYDARVSQPGGGRTAEERILDAAIDAIVSNGPRRTTATDIAARAEVSRMTVYRQFGDVKNTVREAMNRLMRSYLESIMQQAAGETARDRLVSAITGCVVFLGGSPLLCALREHDPQFFGQYTLERFGASQRDAADLIVQMIGEGHADGSIRPLDADSAAVMIVLTAQAFVVGAPILWARDDNEAIVSELNQMLERYLAA
nr:TetR/AcrR family transcriptional regulator [Arsenicicoccus piscis]